MADDARFDLTDEEARVGCLKAEARFLEKNPVPECCAQPVTDDLLQWAASIHGPAGSPYESGIFQLIIYFPKDYTSTWPTMTFSTKILHPLRNKEGGICSVCVLNGIPNRNTFRGYGVLDILQSIRRILGDPGSSCPHIHADERTLNPGPESYSQTAKAWTKMYAS